MRVRTRLRTGSIARIWAFLADHPPPEAGRVILFGSLARNTHDGALGADLMVVGGAGEIDTGLWDAAERDVDIVPWTAEAWARGQASGHPFVLIILREGIKLWRATGLPPPDQA